MRKLFIAIILLFPFSIFAQPRFQVGVTGGANMITSLKSIFKTGYSVFKEPANYSNGFGFTSTLKFVFDTHIIQAGAGVEAGTLQCSMPRQLGLRQDIENANALPALYGPVELEKQKLANYVSPHLFVHAKINIGRHVYLYIGPVGGRMFSKNDLSWDGKDSGWFVGGNLGASIALSDRISLEIAEGWRMVWVNGEKVSYGSKNRREWYNAKVINTYQIANGYELDEVAIAINNYKFSYGNTSVGVRINL